MKVDDWQTSAAEAIILYLKDCADLKQTPSLESIARIIHAYYELEAKTRSHLPSP